MKLHRAGFRWIAIAVVSFWLGFAAAPDTAFAQKRRNDPTPAGPKEQSYHWQYILLALTLGLGLATVCRPSRRQQFQSVVYQEKTDLVHGK